MNAEELESALVTSINDLKKSKESLEEKERQIKQETEEIQYLKSQLESTSKAVEFYKLKIENVSSEVQKKEQLVNDQEDLSKMYEDYVNALKTRISGLESDLKDYREIAELEFFDMKKN